MKKIFLSFFALITANLIYASTLDKNASSTNDKLKDNMCTQVINYVQCCPDGKTEIITAVRTLTYNCTTGVVKNDDMCFTHNSCPKSSSTGTTQSELVFDEP